MIIKLMKRMVKFRAKKIKSNPSLGEVLSTRRQEREISLRQAARETGIGNQYLQVLETGDYHQLPGEVYAKSFLKVYATYLGLEAEPLLQAYCSEQKIHRQTTSSEHLFDANKPVERVLWSKLMVTPKIIRNATVGLVIAVILIYLGVKVTGIIAPPPLVIEQPQDNLVTSDKVIEISGAAGQEAVVKINGQEVLTDGQGKFIETFVLQPGANVIEVTAEKKHSRQATIFRKVMVIKES